MAIGWGGGSVLFRVSLMGSEDGDEELLKG